MRSLSVVTVRVESVLNPVSGLVEPHPSSCAISRQVALPADFAAAVMLDSEPVAIVDGYRLALPSDDHAPRLGLRPHEFLLAG